MVVFWKFNKFNLPAMKKIFTQGLTLAAMFLGLWFLLQKLDWTAIFSVEEISSKTEQKLGELFWEILKNTEKENENPFVLSTIDSIVTKICAANNISAANINVHVLDTNSVNAFALPGRRLVLFSGLILETENQEELAGVIAHEIAHIELRHVMKKLIKEFGVSVLISMTIGRSGSPDIIGETVRMLSSTAFDRELEREADIKAVDYLFKANIDPEPFAGFLYRLSENDRKIIRYLTWISTHPDSKTRAEYIIEHGKNTRVDPQQIISKETWDRLLKELRD